jgi:hypothetical protein
MGRMRDGRSGLVGGVGIRGITLVRSVSRLGGHVAAVRGGRRTRDGWGGGEREGGVCVLGGGLVVCVIVSVERRERGNKVADGVKSIYGRKCSIG